MKLRILAAPRSNPLSIYRYEPDLVDEEETEDNLEPLYKDNDPSEMPAGATAKGQDMANRLPSGGRSVFPKANKLQGYGIPPMY